MGFRFRRSVKIAPGVRVNFGKRGTSLSFGGRGATVTMGKNGTYGNVSIPGTGISFREKLSGDSARQQRGKSSSVAAEKQETVSMAVNVHVSDDGTLEFTEKDGTALDKKLVSAAWKQHPEALKRMLEEHAEEINGDLQLLTHVFTDIPHPSSTPEYTALAYEKPEPVTPDVPKKSNRPVKQSVNKPFFLLMLFEKYQKAYQEALQKAENEHKTALDIWEKSNQEALEKYDEELKAFNSAHAKWAKNKNLFEKQEADKAANFETLIRSDIGIMEETFDRLLQGLEWPRETLISYEISDALDALWLDVDLPEIEDLPQRVATLAASGKKLNIKDKSQKHLRIEYAEHIHGIALRIAGYAFASLPSIQKVIVSGYSQRLNKANGNIEDEYLYSVEIHKEAFTQLNHNDLEKIDPVSSFDMFNAVRKMTVTGIFKPIVPMQPTAS